MQEGPGQQFWPGFIQCFMLCLCTFLDITPMLFRNCTRFSLSFSLVHDKPQKGFKHARSLFLRFIRNKKRFV